MFGALDYIFGVANNNDSEYNHLLLEKEQAYATFQRDFDKLIKETEELLKPPLDPKRLP